MKKKIYEAPATIVFVTTLQNILAGSTGGTASGGQGTDQETEITVTPDPGESGGSGGSDLVEAKPNTHPWSEWDD